MIKHTLKSRQLGLTIIEVMVSVLISLLLLVGVIQIFGSNKQSYRVVEASSRVQESGRFAWHFLAPPIRMAGFTGCSNVKTGGKLNIEAKASVYGAQIQAAINAFGSGQTIRGYTVSGGSVPAEVAAFGLASGTAIGQIPAGITSEVLVITRGGACDGGQIVKVMPDSSKAMFIKDAATCGLYQNALVIVSNCTHSDLFAISNNPLVASGTVDKNSLAHANNVNEDGNLSTAYGTDASIYNINVDVYYVGNGSNGEPALFRRILVAGAYTNQELVEGVNSISALYGVDLDATKDGLADTYINSASVTAANWGNIVSVRLTINAQSLANNIINGNKLTHSFTSTINIRNTR